MEGERLGAYVIDRELGSGGMGKVYAAIVAGRAHGLSEGDRVALKVVHPHLLETPGFFKRFLREAQVGQSVAHDNVVRTLDCDAVGGHHFLVMEYVEGQTLSDLQVELERVPEELCRHVGREICKGLAAIHDAGVVHRDLKPENVLITPEHVVKVMDLGVAHLADEQMRLSQTGAFVGSVEYAAPEQFEGGDVDHRCDLHALGLLLYELACGQHPYRGDDFRGVMRRVCDEEPRRAGEVNPQLSVFFEEVVHTLLAKSAADRFASAGEALVVLEEGEDSEWWHERARQLQATTKRPLRRIRIPRETAVYGREEELAKLRALYDAAKGGDGRVLLIEGEAGIGKSRLVDELVGRLQADGEDLNFLYGGYPPGGAATAAGGFSSAYREQFGEAGSAPYLTETTLLVSAYDAVLRGEPVPDGVTALNNDSLGTCFVHATRSLAAERPTVVLIDDLHFAPEEARAVFTAVARAVPGHRVLLVGTFRPGVPEDWLAHVTRLDHATRMELSRLGPKDIGTLLEDAFASKSLAEEIGYRIVTKSDGNPFFAFEIIRGLREGQFITQRDDGTWASTQVIDEIEIPSSVLDLVNARVADLTEEERDLLDVASCWGYEFDPSLIGEVVGVARIPALKRFGHIERKHRLVRSVGRRYVFDHHQVQEALYGALNEQLREEYHAALARALEDRTSAVKKPAETLDGALCVDLCEHYLQGARGESALRYLAAAQEHLQGGYLNAQVIALTERALAVPDLLSGIARGEALLLLAGAGGPLDLLGRRARQEECVQEAEQLSQETGCDELGGQTANALGGLLAKTSRRKEAEAAFRRALALARACGDQKAVARATANLGTVISVPGRFSEAQEHLERAIALLRELGLRQGEARATGNLGNALRMQGRVSEANDLLARRLAIACEMGDRDGEAVATGNLGLVFLSRGRLSVATEHFQRSLALCREIGARQGEAIAATSLGRVFEDEGRLTESEECYRRHLALSRETGYREGEAVAQHRLGGLLREAGERERSEQHLLRSLALSEEVGDRDVEAWTHLALGSLRASGGDVDGARESLVAARESGFNNYEVLARCELALLPGGDAQGAITALAEHEPGLRVKERCAARLLLWKATGVRAQLAAAKRLLDEALTLVPEEYHESMCRNLRVNREILAAWQAEFEDDDGDGPDGAESITRAG